MEKHKEVSEEEQRDKLQEIHLPMGFVSNPLFCHPGTYMGGEQHSLYLWGTDACLVTVPEMLFFLPEQRAQLLTETGIACSNLLPSSFEGNFIPWFDPAIPSPMLIALNLNDISIYLYYCCAALTL